MTKEKVHLAVNLYFPSSTPEIVIDKYSKATAADFHSKLLQAVESKFWTGNLMSNYDLGRYTITNLDKYGCNVEVEGDSDIIQYLKETTEEVWHVVEGDNNGTL